MALRVTYIIIAFVLITSALVVIPSNQFPNVSAATKTWNQTSGNLASTDANWVGGVKPSAGDDVVFDSTSTAACTWDLAITLATFSMNSGYSGTVTNAASTNWGTTGAITIAQGTFTGNDASYITCGGNFVHSGGTVTGDKVNLIMTGASTTLRSSANLNSLDIQNDVTQVTNSCSSRWKLNIASGKTFTISTGLNHQFYFLVASGSFTNSGTIAGTGAAIFRFLMGSTVSPTVTFGGMTIANLEIKTYSGGSSRTMTLGASASISSAVTVSSLDATNTATLDLSTNNYGLTCGGMTIGTRGILNARGSTITCSGSWDSSAGTFTSGTSTVKMTGTGVTMKTGASQSFPNLNISGRVTTPSSTNVSKNLTVTDNHLLTISSGKTLYYNCSGGGVYDNDGTIAGSGTMAYSFTSVDKTLTFGTIATNLTWIWAKSSASASRTLTMSGSGLFCGSLLLNSSHASYLMIFDTMGGDVTIRNTFTNGTRGMVYYGNPWTVLNLSQGSFPYQYQINVAGDAFYAQNMVTGLIELTDIDYADNVTQYAIDNSLTNEEVNFANGTFIFRSSHDFYVGGWNCSVYLNTTFNLTISGSGSSILEYRSGLTVATGKGVTIFLIDDRSENLTIRDLVFEDGPSTTATYRAPMFFYHPTTARPGFRNVSVENCTFTDLNQAIWGDGMYYYGSNNRFINNVFDGSSLNLHNTPSQVLVSGNEFLNAQLWIDSVSNITCSNNTFSDNTGTAIFMYDVTADIYIRDNTLIAASQVDTYGIHIDSVAGKSDCYRTTIERNGFSTFKWAVRIEASNDTWVENNTFLTVIKTVVSSGTDVYLNSNTNYTIGAGFGPASIGPGYIMFEDEVILSASSEVQQINVTLEDQNEHNSWEWSLNTNTTVQFFISSLRTENTYKVYQDSMKTALENGPSFDITVTDNTTIEVVVWYSQSVSTLIVLAYDMVALGILMSVIVAMVSPLKDPKKRRTDIILKTLVQTVIFVVLGTILLTLVGDMFLG